MADRPMTVREMQAAKKAKQEQDENKVTIINVSRQLIKIHEKAPKGVDFYIGASDISLKPNQMYAFKKSRLWEGQVTRLQKQGMIRIVSDTSTLKKDDETRRQVVKER